MHRDNAFLNRLIERLDRIDSASVQNYLLKLVREKGFLQTVFDSLREGVLVIDRQIRLVYSNLAARTLLGIPADSDGQRLDRFIREVDWLGLMEADPEEWQRVSLREMEVFYPFNRLLTFYVVPLPDENGGGDISLAAIILHDATATREATAKDIETKRSEAIRHLAAGVAHELGNPLNSLAIHLQILTATIAEAIPDADKRGDAAELLGVALHEVQRLDSILGNFLRAMRPPPVNLQPVEMQMVLAEAIRFMRREIEDRGVRVEATLPKHLPTIMGDAAQLKQAFYNIMKNSIQAMSGEGLLTIECRVNGNFLDVLFADTGKGIAAADMAHIMDPFFTTRPEGSGLGLLVVERICRAHGAEFAIESASGQGTTFLLKFPLRDRQTRLLQASRRHADETVDINPA